MADVQSVFQTAWTGGKVLLVFFLFLVTLMTWRGHNIRQYFTGLQYGGILSASLIAVIGVLAIVGRDVCFIAFHQLFFLPGSWTFAQTDTLIRLFPLPFWFDGALTVSALSLAGRILLGVMDWVLKRRSSETAI